LRRGKGDRKATKNGYLGMGKKRGTGPKWTKSCGSVTQWGNSLTLSLGGASCYMAVDKREKWAKGEEKL